MNEMPCTTVSGDVRAMSGFRRLTVSDGTPEGARQSRARHNERHAQTPLVGTVPKGEVVHQAGKQASLKDAQQEPRSHKPWIVPDTAGPGGDGPPAHHQERDPFLHPSVPGLLLVGLIAHGVAYTRRHSLEKVVRWDLEQRVGDQKQHQRDDVRVVGDVQLRLQIIAVVQIHDARVPDIRPVEVAEEVDERRQRHDPQILSPQQASVFRCR